MSREIKFRVWVESIVEEETGMYIPDYISSWQNGTTWDIDKVYTKMREPGGFKFKEDTCKFTLMQYTGLKDANGVDIYEGDIVVKYGKTSDIVYGTRYIEGHYEVTDFHPRNIEDGMDENFDPDLCVVVGNIYEHPELLETDDATS